MENSVIVINLKEKALVDTDTGDIVRPNCWDDLIPYVSYVKNRGHPQLAQSILEEVFKGEKIITKMVTASQKRVGQ